MLLRELVLKNRTRRRFQENTRISMGTLTDLVDLGRLSPSAGNLQPLKYILSNDPKKNAAIFPCLSWAGYLRDWPGPPEGERPAAYIIVVGDTTIGHSFDVDSGIAVQSIMLGAAECGLGGCIIGSIDRKRLQESLDIPDRYQVLLVLALGRPKETVALDTMKGDDVRYWRGKNGVHHVPKRRIKDLILR